MHELIIAPKIYKMVSPSIAKFIESNSSKITKFEQKPYEYVGAGSRIPDSSPSLPLNYSRHPYFCPDANINAADEEVAKHIRILG